MKNIVFIAPPAAGKGTQSDLLKQEYNLAHISTGDLLRAEATSGTERGKYIGEIQASGGIVDDDIVLELLEKRINEPDCNNGYILDGFPRTINQAIKFDEVATRLDKKIEYVIFLSISKEEAMKRTLGRVTCPACGAIYNIYNDVFDKDGFCNKCFNKLEKRDDDNEETFNHRFDAYLEKTQPLIDYYNEKCLLYVVDSGIDKYYTFSQIEKIINGECK